MRVHPDTYPIRLTSFLAQTPSGAPEWFDWDDATTPRTDRPVRFNAGYRLHAFAAQLGRTFAPSFTYRQRGGLTDARS